MTDDKIRIEWDDLKSPDVDARLEEEKRRRAAAGHGSLIPPSSSAWQEAGVAARGELHHKSKAASWRIKGPILCGLILAILIGCGGCWLWLKHQEKKLEGILSETDRLISKRKPEEAIKSVERMLTICRDSYLTESRRARYEPWATETLSELQTVTDTKGLRDILSKMTDDELTSLSKQQAVPPRFQRKESKFTPLMADKLKELLPAELRSREEKKESERQKTIQKDREEEKARQEKARWVS